MAGIESSDFAKSLAKIIAAAWDDEELKQELLAADANRERQEAALDKHNRKTGQRLEFPKIPGAPEGAALRFVANTPEIRNVVIPVKPQFTDVDLGAIVKERQLFALFCECVGGDIGGGDVD